MTKVYTVIHVIKRSLTSYWPNLKCNKFGAYNFMIDNRKKNNIRYTSQV